MPRINGVDITQPESGGGGGFTNALMGIFRERTRAQQQLNMMAYGSALDVASKAAETEITADIGRKALVKDFKTVYAKHSKDVMYPAGHARAGEVKYKAGEYKNPELAQHMSEAGLESTPYGYKFSPSSLTKATQMREKVGPFSQYSAPTPSQANVTTGPEKPGRGGKKTAAAKPAPTETAEAPIPTMPVVNNTPQPIEQVSTGDRVPRATKGGFRQPSLPGMGKISRTTKKQTSPTTQSSLGMGDMPNA